MEKSKAATIRFEAPVKVRPAIDFMHGFISDKLFQNQSGGVPTDTLKTQEAAIEPGPEQMLQVEIQCGKISVVIGSQHMFSQGDESFSATWGRVDAAEQLLARRFDGCIQRGQ